jgi:hypothetical protein
MKDALTELRTAAGRLPEKFDDFALSRGPITASGLTSGGEQTLERFKPYLDAVDWHGAEGIRGPKHIRQQFEMTYRLMVAHALMILARTNQPRLHAEATLAGTDIPTFTRQLIRTVLRAYPKLITPQLFPVQPLFQSDGRIYFELTKYDSAYASSTPNVSANDVTADLTKFNAGFFEQNAQMADLGMLKVDLSNYIVVSAITKGLAALSSLQAEEDFSSTYGRDYNALLSERFVSHLQWVIDREMLNAALNNVPAGNVVTWKRQPTINSVAWANQLPSEKSAWRETIWHDGFLPVFTAIYNRHYVRPNWAVAGAAAAEDISRVSSFKPILVDDSTIDMRQGAIRDIGTVDNGGMRVLVDPQLNTDTVLFGYRPTMEMEPAIVFCPYRAIGMAPDLTYPRQLKREKGAYTRFAIGKPDATVPESAHLADCYGKLTVSSAA